VLEVLEPVEPGEDGAKGLEARTHAALAGHVAALRRELHEAHGQGPPPRA